MYRSIFKRLFWTNVMILFIVLMSVSVAMTIFLNNYIAAKQYQMAVKTSSNIEYLTIMLQIESNQPRSQAMYDNMLSSWSELTNSDITVVDQYGTVCASTNSVQRVPSELAKGVLAGKTITTRTYFGNYYAKKVFVVGIPIHYQNRVFGGMFFNTPLPDMNQTVLEFMNMLIVSSFAAIILAFILVYIQSKRISAPIKKINQAVNKIASGKFENRIKVESADEIGQLASSFNYMADNLERLEEMRSSFVSDVSHELRTPMTSISGFIGGILDGTIPPEKEREYLQIAYDESVRLTKLTNDMLEMSKMSSSEYKLDIKKFDINELIRLCIIQLEQRISDKGLELEVDFSKDVIMVLADQDAIRRVVINILDNAVKFSFENTKILISTWAKDEYAYVSIGNFGIGIEKESIPHIFDRFYKTDRSRTGDKKGAGLGLSFVKNIITLHKQQIWVDSSEPKEGSSAKFTKFTFTLEKA